MEQFCLNRKLNFIYNEMVILQTERLYVRQYREDDIHA